MKLFHNPEIIKLLLIQGILLFSASIAGFYHDATTGILVLISGLFLILFFLLFTSARYGRLESLSRRLDEMLHTEASIPLSDYAEGELSILQNELAKLMLKLKEQEHTLRRDKKYLADAMADISHQLRSPLTSMQLILSLLRTPDLSSEKRASLLRDLSCLLTKIDWLVESLLKMSSMDAGTIQFSPVSVSVEELISNASSSLLIPMELREQKLLVHTKNHDTLFVDPSWTAEALSNVLKNCMEHTPIGGTIEIFCRDNTLFTEIIIEDNGPGFSTEDLPHLFERFYRGKNATENSIGIGLALSRMIVTRENGTLKAENKSSGGARFTFKFYRSNSVI